MFVSSTPFSSLFFFFFFFFFCYKNVSDSLVLCNAFLYIYNAFFYYSYRKKKSTKKETRLKKKKKIGRKTKKLRTR